MKKIFISIIYVLLFTAVQAQNYEIVYSCDFENENYPEWYLATTEFYRDYMEEYDERTTTDMFYISNAVAYESTKSLYVSEDNGISNNIHIKYNTQEINSGNKISIADLNINLSAGNYIISFVYKSPYPQSMSAYIKYGRFFDNIINDIYLSSTNDWTHKEESFTIPNGQQANWITFWYESGMQGGERIVEGLVIDNIVIKKENQGQAVSQTSADNLSVFVNNRTISVENAASAVQVLDISGRVAAQGAGSGIYEVSQAGVYIVKSGAAVRKVVVN
jgi:hypothetical protein